MVPEIRIAALNGREVNPAGQYVLYWMVANRRRQYNFALQHAADLAARLGRPLLVLEALRVDYPHASDRLHAFVIQGMADNARELVGPGVGYYPYLEPAPGVAKGLLAALAAQACAVITDQFPAFFIPRMQVAAAAVCPVRLEAVDSCGLLPLAAADRDYPTAHSFRRFLQKNLPRHLADMPLADPLIGLSGPTPKPPAEIIRRWPPVAPADLARPAALVAGLPIDHAVPPTATPGGPAAARQVLDRFLVQRLPIYDSQRNQPDQPAASGLSAYLHFGHIAAHHVFAELVRREQWAQHLLGKTASGARAGWWGLGPAAEAFIDQLVTWRELGYNFCHHRGDQASLDSLPQWARQTLDAHAADPRPYVYSLAELEAAQTHSQIWNAAQNQLRAEGVIHNYLRMVWGKKILHWTASPAEALAIMTQLNDRWALDGRDPNSRSGIMWCLGRYDRPWGPERPVFGKVRYMSVANTARKLRLGPYLARYAGGDDATLHNI